MMKKLRLKKLTRARMEQWLREHPKSRFVVCIATSCPVAHYITDVYKDIYRATIGTGAGVIRTDEKTKQIHIPIWASKFIMQVDTRGTGNTITGEQALGILQAI